MSESFPLLTKEEFVATAVAQGHKTLGASMAFGYIVRGSIEKLVNGPRTSEDICYSEMIHGATEAPETVLAIRNVYDKIDQVRAIYHVATLSVDMCIDVHNALVNGDIAD